MSIYTSQGTIRIHYNITGESCHETTIYFVPENNYSIKHKDKQFAVFMPECCNEAVVMKYDPDKGDGVKIDATGLGCTEVISSAAAHQTKVLVQVNGEKCLKLTGITIPAK